MKTPTYTPSPFSFIDTAPLRARYEQMAGMVMLFLDMGQGKEMLRMSYKLARCVKLLIKLETHNQLLGRKRAMLSHPSWRRWVLSGLGGLRKLRLWEAAKARADKRIRERARQPRGPEPYKSKWMRPSKAFLESERLKAHAQRCCKACVPPRFFRDRCKMDRSAKFRLPPLPRGPQGPRQLRIYTKQDISDYEYNAMPFDTETGLGPATVWPIEFYVAIVAEQEITFKTVIPDEAIADDLGANDIEQHVGLGPHSPRFYSKRSGGDDKDRAEDMGLNPIPLRAAISHKTYRDLFENPV